VKGKGGREMDDGMEGGNGKNDERNY